ncbi:hypothetical protein GJ699_06215 [Duganella sp. FT80W]|uniref:Transporter substrate-binding domain-containing protein n=1 Tax=Duganella guangzhouensis TaxID=2666084 RepID=A0A6I2KUW0_9BURK|nr:hypothetical protein [Duganella guangzhouensis]MRW89573.1 hypothetical protein [Duganella guangzhouensis]
MRRREFVTGIALSALAGRLQAAEPNRIVMASLVSTEEGFTARWLELIYNDAFSQLGLTLEIQVMPAARASAEAAAGHVDGELGRSQEYGAVQPKLIRVPEPTFIANTVAYTKDEQIRLKPGWDSLRDTRYRVEFRQGYPVIGRKLAAVVPADRLGGVRNAETGLRKLLLGRSDIYVDMADTVDVFLSRPEFRGIHQAAVLERGPIHAYLNEKHAELAPRLAAVLKKMRESGVIERYRQQALKE